MMSLTRQMVLKLALYSIVLPAFLFAMSPAGAAERQPVPKIELIPNVQPVPKRAGRVTDTAKVMTAEDRARIDKMLDLYERETFHQIAVLTIPTLAGDDIETYSRRVLSSWKLGQPGIDNGMLLTVVMNDKIMRIELGAGMEKYISNADAEAVIDDNIIPAFGRGDYTRGIQAGVVQLMRLGHRFVVKKEDVEGAKRK